jgi:hypothetical protein
MHLAKVRADVNIKGAVMGGLSLPKVVCFLVAVDTTFCITCSFCARSFAAGLIFLTCLRGIKNSIEESGHKPKWRNRGGDIPINTAEDRV